MQQVRVLIADDHPIVREGLRTLIGVQTDMSVVGEAADGWEAIQLARDANPDVILLDLLMPRLDGLKALPKIKEAAPEARILVLTSAADDAKIVAAIKLGAVGYLLKDTLPTQLLDAIRGVYRGEVALPPEVARLLVRELRRPEGAKPLEAEALSEREVEVLGHVARGLSNRQIADHMVISERTVHSHVSRILRKLHLHSRTQATLYALQEGLATVDKP